jgi:N-acetylglutamate synthase-like GNAT family acetyltransferase
MCALRTLSSQVAGYLEASRLQFFIVTATPRPATESDLASIEALVSSAYEKYVARIGRKPKPMLANYRVALAEHQLWVCEGEQGLVAVLELIPAKNHLLIENVAVSPALQRSGLGRSLVAFAENEARRQDFSEVQLYTNEQFAGNVALYSRLGYRETHREPFQGTNVIHMAKAI